MKLLFKLIYNISKTLALLKLKKRAVLIIKLDGIGDYILFRNFLEEIKNAPEFCEKRIVLCGNNLWKDIALEFDCKFIDRYIWIKKDKIKNTTNLYCYIKCLKLNWTYYENVIHPTYSRDYISEFLVQNIFSPNKITMIGDDTCLPQDVLKNYDRNYNELINVGKNNDFDFYKNKIFTEKILKRNIDIKRPVMNLNRNKYKDTIVVFIGASHLIKKWNYMNYCTLIKKLSNIADTKFLLCGSKEDFLDANKIMLSNNTNKIVNLVGTTNLLELIRIISNSRFVITNDTGIVHISGALDVKTFCLYRGEYMGRFQPYPLQTRSTITTIMKRSNLLKDFYEKKEINDVPYDINDISVEHAFSIISKNIIES